MDCSVHFILPTLRIQNNEDQNLNQNQNFVFCMTTSEPKKVLSLQKEFSQWWTHHSRLWLTSPDAWVARGNPTSPRRVVREMPRCPSTWIETPFFAEIRKSLWNTQEHTASITYLYMCTYVYIYTHHHIIWYYQHILTRLSSYYQMYSIAFIYLLYVYHIGSLDSVERLGFPTHGRRTRRESRWISGRPKCSTKHPGNRMTADDTSVNFVIGSNKMIWFVGSNNTNNIK